MDASTEAAERTIRDCVDVFNRCTAEWVDRYYAADVEWAELPTAAIPQGRGGARAALRAAEEARLALFPDRRMRIRNLVAQGDQVVVELDWWGTAARAMGDVSAGATVRLRIASFFRVVDGRIVRHTDYCVRGREE